MASGPSRLAPPAYVFEVFSHGGTGETMPHAFVEYYDIPNGYRLVMRGDDGTTSAIDCTCPAVFAFLQQFVETIGQVVAA